MTSYRNIEGGADAYPLQLTHKSWRTLLFEGEWGCFSAGSYTGDCPLRAKLRVGEFHFNCEKQTCGTGLPTSRLAGREHTFAHIAGKGIEADLEPSEKCPSADVLLPSS